MQHNSNSSWTAQLYLDQDEEQRYKDDQHDNPSGVAHRTDVSVADREDGDDYKVKCTKIRQVTLIRQIGDVEIWTSLHERREGWW